MNVMTGITPHEIHWNIWVQKVNHMLSLILNNLKYQIALRALCRHTKYVNLKFNEHSILYVFLFFNTETASSSKSRALTNVL